MVNIFFGEETVMGGIYQKSSETQNTTCLNITLYPFIFFVTEMERRIRMGPIEFISSLGGLFGLCLGFSFISFFEIIYWAIIALSRCLMLKYHLVFDIIG